MQWPMGAGSQPPGNVAGMKDCCYMVGQVRTRLRASLRTGVANLVRGALKPPLPLRPAVRLRPDDGGRCCALALAPDA